MLVNLITSRVSGRGNRIGPVRLSVCEHSHSQTVWLEDKYLWNKKYSLARYFKVLSMKKGRSYMRLWHDISKRCAQIVTIDYKLAELLCVAAVFTH